MLVVEGLIGSFHEFVHVFYVQLVLIIVMVCAARSIYGYLVLFS